MIRIALVLIALGLIAYGLFEPFLGVKLFKDRSFFELSKIGSYLWLGLIVLVAWIAIKKLFKWLLIAGLLAFGLLAYSVYETISEKGSIKQQIDGGMDSSPLKSLTMDLVENVHFREGFVYMAAGVFILLGVAILGPRIAWRFRKPPQETGG